MLLSSCKAKVLHLAKLHREQVQNRTDSCHHTLQKLDRGAYPFPAFSMALAPTSGDLYCFRTLRPMIEFFQVEQDLPFSSFAMKGIVALTQGES